ncbi:MAG: hypothetical protein JWM68_5086 [Verrucomicrobiales bacterium]|nr:hypothetical protein [Verrucomicrobiales bacterium]
MKKGMEPLSVKKSPQTEQKSSGITSHKPPGVAAKSRKDKDIPADRGAYEIESLVQGSE